MRTRGFTVIELVVALSIAGLVLLLGGAGFGVLAGSAEATRRAELESNRRRNGVRWLQRTLRSLEVGSLGAVPFVGEPAQLRFSSRALVAGGGWELRVVELRVEGTALVGATGRGDGGTTGRGDGGTAGRRAEGTTGREDGGTRVVLVEGVRQVEFDYLIVPGLDSRWTHAWQSPVSAPLAVRLRLASADSAGVVDTLLFLVGERG